jgi:hypothetical protein
LFYHLQREGKFDQDRSRFYAAELLCALEHLHGFNVVYRYVCRLNADLEALPYRFLSKVISNLKIFCWTTQDILLCAISVRSLFFLLCRFIHSDIGDPTGLCKLNMSETEKTNSKSAFLIGP